MTVPQRCSAQSRRLDAGVFQAEIGSFGLYLAAGGKAARTIRAYTEAVQWFAAAHLLGRTGRDGWCCAALILRMSVTLMLGMRGLWKTPPDGFRRGWVVLGVSRVVLRVSR